MHLSRTTWKENEIPTIYFKYTKVSSQLKTIPGVHKYDNYYREKENFTKLRKNRPCFFSKSIIVFTRLNAAAFITEIFKSF